MVVALLALNAVILMGSSVNNFDPKTPTLGCVIPGILTVIDLLAILALTLN